MIKRVNLKSDYVRKWASQYDNDAKKKCSYNVVYSMLQAMGVYLFGELILSRDKAQRKLAEDSFRAIADDMEDSVYKTVHLMVYGT